MFPIQKPCRFEHPDYQEGCKVCYLFTHDERYKNLTTRKADFTVFDGSNTWRWVSLEELGRVTKEKLLPQLPRDISLVCGVARSGMIPASMLSTLLNLPLGSISQETGEISFLTHGTRKINKVLGKVLVVEDTCYSGKSIASLKLKLGRENHLYASSFIRPEITNFVDFYGELLSSPQLLEWNFWNSVVLRGGCLNTALRGGIAADFDGILCENPTLAEEQDPVAFELWLKLAKPLAFPREVTLPLVITARLEKYRNKTLDWCDRWGIKVQNFIFFPGSLEERKSTNIAQWKAAVFQESKHALYVESESYLARNMIKFTQKPVVCPKEGRVYHASSL